MRTSTVCKKPIGLQYTMTSLHIRILLWVPLHSKIRFFPASQIYEKHANNLGGKPNRSRLKQGKAIVTLF